MSAALASPAAIIRELLLSETAPTEGTTITGLRTPLGDSIALSVFDTPALSHAHENGRLELTDMHRGDTDSDLGVAVAPSGLAGIDHAAPEAWNVSMTLPTLARILGQDITTEKE